MPDTIESQVQIGEQLPNELMQSITNKALSVLEEFAVHGKRSLELSLQLGAHISMGKKILPHGEFASWHENTLHLGASQVSVYRRLFGAKADIGKAREWAKGINRPHHDSDSPERVLALIKEWKKAMTHPANGGECPNTDTYADKLKELLQTDEQAKTLRENLTRGIAGPLEKAAIAILAKGSSMEGDLLVKSDDYLRLLVENLGNQTCGVPQLCIPTEGNLAATQDGAGPLNEHPHERLQQTPQVGPSRETNPTSNIDGRGKDLLTKLKPSPLMRAIERR